MFTVKVTSRLINDGNWQYDTRYWQCDQFSKLDLGDTISFTGKTNGDSVVFDGDMPNRPLKADESGVVTMVVIENANGQTVDVLRPPKYPLPPSPVYAGTEPDVNYKCEQSD